MSRSRLVIWTRFWDSMHPESATMNEVLNQLAKRIDDLIGGFRREADEVDDNVSIQIGDCRSERSGCFLHRAVDDDATSVIPFSRRVIRRALSSRDGDYLMPTANQSRNKPRPDMP